MTLRLNFRKNAIFLPLFNFYMICIFYIWNSLSTISFYFAVTTSSLLIFFIKVYREMFISLQLIKMARDRGNVELYQATNFCDKVEQHV